MLPLSCYLETHSQHSQARILTFKDACIIASYKRTMYPLKHQTAVGTIDAGATIGEFWI